MDADPESELVGHPRPRDESRHRWTLAQHAFHVNVIPALSRSRGTRTASRSGGHRTRSGGVERARCSPTPYRRPHMKCLRCQAALDLSKTQCAACGAPVDADGDGVPDVLAKMIEDKARALLATEKQREEEAAREAFRVQADAAEAAARRADEAQLAYLRGRRDASLSTVPRLWYASSGMLVLFALVAVVIGGCMLPFGLETTIGRSIVAAHVFCPSVCRGCRGPGRVVAWRESGSWYEADVSAEICHNRAVDIDRLTWNDITDREDKDLAPYRLTRWASVLMDFGLVFLPLLLVGPLVAAPRRRRQIERDCSCWEVEIDELERKLHHGGTRSPGDSP
ncbi:putative membrane protein [Sorangium cellulosum So ce56]|uniref:Membrane protein n=2 Tax=Sorangium cellulosum TaxID=56 RepID=A9FUM9_SORC5|nr:putative membrane protein [Sorangium cellulosum So ce56]